MSLDLAPSNSSRLFLIITGAIFLVIVGVGAYAWYDHLAAQRVTVSGNVWFAGVPVEGARAPDVRDAVEEREREILAKQVVVETPIGEISYTLEELGFVYRSDKATNSLLMARHSGGFFEEFGAWATTLIVPIRVSDPIEVHPDRARAVLDHEPRLEFSRPAEPGISLTDDDVLVATLGTEGLRANLDDLVDEIESLDPTEGDLRVRTTSAPIEPSVSDNEASRVVDKINEATRGGATVIVNGQTRALTPADLRRLISVTVGDGTLIPELDGDGLQLAIEALYPDPVGTPVLPTFEVKGETVRVATPGTAPDVCCEEGSAAPLSPAILDGASGPFSLRSKPETDSDLIALYDGSLVVERVSSFTTPHSCCENRVKNIQRMADIVRGYYMAPGDILSLNDYVGPRTEERGFLPAGAIRLGRLTPEIGGGVSQFATTIFNAAYFAGLDILEYQAHSLYFTRYPFGREATISSPAPDLVFQNTTPYPILIWTSYTGTSITVSMYSTKNVSADQIATRTSKRQECTYVETDRERIYNDGRRDVDTFFALYRPADGIDCNGNPIPE